MTHVVSAERIKHLREQRGLSRESLAQKAKLSAKTVSRLELGKRSTARENTIKSLCEAFGIKRQDLLANECPSSIKLVDQTSGDLGVYQLSGRVSSDVHNAYSLIAQRYNVKVTTIL
jgi:transcriptional regulator with XRE-family HTH domain